MPDRPLSHHHHSPFHCGVFAGISSQLVCHPIDTIRTRLQVGGSKRFLGLRDVVSNTLKNEGVKGFYKGLSSPLLAQGIYKAIIFSTHSAVRGAIRKEKFGHFVYEMRDPFGGFCAGSLNALVVTPVEFVRNRLQTNYSSLSGPHRPLDVVRSSIQRYASSSHAVFLRDPARPAPSPDAFRCYGKLTLP